MQAYSSVYSVEQEVKQELQKQEQAKQQKEDLEGRIHETELRIAKLTEKSQDSRTGTYTIHETSYHTALPLCVRVNNGGAHMQ